MVKCYNRQWCTVLCTCISLFDIIGISLVLLTETIYSFQSERYKETTFSGWTATILYFICLSNLSNAQCSYLLCFSTKIGSQWQAKKWRKFYQHSQLITEVLDYFVAAMVDATTHSSSLLSFLEKKPFSYYFQLLNHGQLLQIWSY